MNLPTDKTSLRAAFKSRLAGLPAAELIRRSEQACRFIADSPQFAAARMVMIYLPLTREVDPTLLATEAWRDGKKVAVPLANPERRTMEPVQLDSLDQPMDIDRMGVRTPHGAPLVALERIDLVMVPGMGFDRRGHRLGRGAGFYDRFLIRLPVTCVSCGIGLIEQLTDTLPVDPHDQPLDMLATDRDLLLFSENRA
jgi:5-formyltetrahydrofolate cyclo-ligase